MRCAIAAGELWSLGSVTSRQCELESSSRMPRYVAVLTLVVMLGMVLTRVLMLRRKGVEAIRFGKIDTTDCLIPPCAVLYCYLVFAAAFNGPAVSTHAFFQTEAIAWIGVAFCFAGLLLLLSSLVAFGQSFRVGIDTDHADTLMTTGVFALSSNPIYVAFAVILLGQFLIFPNGILLTYIGAGTWLFHRQVLREGVFLRTHDGQEYLEYCNRVRRYL
jgi:protein-S-isoprenylcysteine O-methyltransferase Ste14